MTITAVVTRPNLIIANTAQLTSTQSNPPIDLKNNGTGVSQNYVHNLLDVVESDLVDGATLVYHANTHKYVVQPITPNVDNADIDGGNF